MDKEKLLRREDASQTTGGNSVSGLDLDSETIESLSKSIYAIEVPEGLSNLEVDVIKHTAQFVAKNGKKFLMALTEREKQNPSFEFLKPTNWTFNFFINLVNAYQKIL